MIKQIKFVFAVGVLVASGAASATTCANALISFNSCGGSASCEAQIMGFHPECFSSGSNTAAAGKNVQSTSLETMLVVSANAGNRSSAISGPPGKTADSGQRNGLAAGNPAGKWNGWVSVAESDVKYDRGTFKFAGAGADRTNKFDTRIDNFVLGGDYMWSPSLALGLSASFDRGRGSVSSYTIAAPDAAKSVSTSGYSYAPYFGWQITKDWALDGMIGWGKGKSTVTSDATVTSDSKRFFYGTNLGYTRWYGNMQITGKGSYLVGREDNDDSKNNGTVTANTKVSNELRQLRVGAQAAFWMNGIMPYVGLAYANNQISSTATADQQDATAMGAGAYVWSLGANFISVKDAMTGGIGFEQETGRSRSKNNKLMANINVRF